MTFTDDPIGLKTTAVPAPMTFLHDRDRLSAEYGAAGAAAPRYVPGPGVDEPLVWCEKAGTASLGPSPFGLRPGRPAEAERGGHVVARRAKTD